MRSKYNFNEAIENVAKELEIGKVEVVERIAKIFNKNRSTVYRWIALKEEDESSVPTGHVKKIAQELNIDDWTTLVN